MGVPHTIDVCINCGDPVINWNNEGRWEHLATGEDNREKNSLYITGSNNNIADPAVCNNPRLLDEQSTVEGRTTENYRTARPKFAG